MSQRQYKYRLYPNHQQRSRLLATVETCRHLYNDALQERIDAYKTCRKRINYYDQANQLPGCKAVCPEMVSVYSQVLQDVLRRLDKTYKAFFRRGHGFPRFKPTTRYTSFTYPQSGFSVSGGTLKMSGIGNVNIKLHRSLVGQVKTLTVKNENGRWYACFACEVPAEPLPASEYAIGIDVGLESFATFSDGEVIENPRWYQQAQRKLRVAQRKVSRRQKGSNRRHKAVQLLRRVHQYIFNQRNDFQHKLSRELVSYYGAIFVEDINIKGLARGMLAKSVLDAGWSSFIAKLAYKAESAGRWLVKVDARGTSQRCPCGKPVPKKLADRFHKCSRCGLTTTRDHAAALEILRLGLSLQAVSTVQQAVFA
jgi:putative transposase